jgi:large subunit ribosomal protein L30e
MKALEKVIKDAVAADKYKIGVKEVLQSVKGSKLVIVSKSIDLANYEYSGTSVQLGKMCNKSFRITAIAIKSGTAAEIDAIMSETGTAAK